MREEARMKVEVPYEPTTYFKRHGYNNHNQVSIVGNGNGNFPSSGMTTLNEGDPLSPNGNSGFNKNGTGMNFNRV